MLCSRLINHQLAIPNAGSYFCCSTHAAKSGCDLGVFMLCDNNSPAVPCYLPLVRDMIGLYGLLFDHHLGSWNAVCRPHSNVYITRATEYCVMSCDVGSYLYMQQPVLMQHSDGLTRVMAL